MTSYNFKVREGNTPIDEDQVQGLMFTHLTTMAEIDELEDLNIQKGTEWLNSQNKKDYLSIDFLCKLHTKLFGDVWIWAGKFRKVEVNISRPRSHDVGPQLKNLFEDTKIWIASDEMSWDEIFAELHHRLVAIHPYPNGNGRTTRIYVEHVQRQNKQPVTSWMSSLEGNSKERRLLYITALKKADNGDYSPLIKFMKEKVP